MKALQTQRSFLLALLVFNLTFVWGQELAEEKVPIQLPDGFKMTVFYTGPTPFNNFVFALEEGH